MCDILLRTVGMSAPRYKQHVALILRILSSDPRPFIKDVPIMIVSGPGDADDVTSGICSLVLSAVMDAWRAAAPICTTGMGCGCDVSPCNGWALLGCVRADVATWGPCVPREVRVWGTCVAGRDGDVWADECDRVVTIGVGRLCTSWCTWMDCVAWLEVGGLGERVLSDGWALVCLLLDTKVNSCSPSS